MMLNNIKKWFQKLLCNIDRSACLEKEASLTKVIEHIIEDFNQEIRQAEETNDKLTSDVDNHKNNIDLIENKLMVKNHELLVLTNKLNSIKLDTIKNIDTDCYIVDESILKPGVEIKISFIIDRFNKMNAYPIYCFNDNYYLSIDKDTIEELLKQNSDAFKDKTFYSFDLKDIFSQPLLQDYACGWARSTNHDFNFFIDKNLDIWIIESKTLKIVLYDDILKNGYFDADNIDDPTDYRITSYLL